MVGITPDVPPDREEIRDVNMIDANNNIQEPLNNNNVEMAVENDDIQQSAELEEVKTVFPPDPPLGEQKGFLRWKIEGFDEITEKKIYSETFSCGPHAWNAMIFPRGNNSTDLSMYLNVVGTSKYPVDSYKYVHFAFGVVNQLFPDKTSYRDLRHEFKKGDADWGLTTNQWHLKELLDESEGYLVDGAIIVEYYVQILECSSSIRSKPTADTTNVVLPRRRANYWANDSKKETGHVGISNQGVTCYMNSLLQTLFFTGPLRRAVYRIPTDDDTDAEKEKSKQGMQVVKALQNLFYRLQSSDSAASTKALTKAFGWNSYDTFVQHDVQELSRVLLDNLDEKMKSTPLEGCLNKIFEGKILHSIRCLDVQYQSTRDETFLDLSLVVKGCDDIFKSFDTYTQVEVLEGDNMYRAEGFDELQRAEKGCTFISFPPVLHLHLKRFDFDFERLTNYKVNDRYEFPRRLNLNKYLGEKADRTKSYEYELHGVLVHSGDVHGGHYYAFIRPTSDGQWLKFDDDHVSLATEEEAMDNNFGGDEGFKYELAGAEHDNIRKRVTNAYYLVYYRVDIEQEYAAEMSELDVPEGLMEKFQAEAQEEEAARKEELESYKFRDVKVLTNQELLKHESYHVYDFSKISSLRVARSSTLSEFKLLLADIYSVSPHRMRLWHFITRSNKTVRIDKPYSEEDESKTLGDIDLQSKVVKLFVEMTDTDTYNMEEKPMNLVLESSEMNVSQEGESESEEERRKKRWPAHPSAFSPKPPNMIYLFVKEYNEMENSLRFIGSMYADLASPIRSLVAPLNRLRGVPVDAPIRIYEEITHLWIESHNDLDKGIREAELTSGDIMVVQRGDALSTEEVEKEIKKIEEENDMMVDESNLSVEELEDHRQRVFDILPKHLKFPDPKPYYKFITSRVVVEFRKLDKPDEEGVKIEMNDSDSFRKVITALASVIRADKDYIRLTGTNYRKEPRIEPFRASLAPSLNDMRMITYYEPSADCLYYEVLDVPLLEIENQRMISMPWFGLNTNLVKNIDVTVEADGTVKDLIDKLLPLAPLEEGGSGKIRIMENWASYSSEPCYDEKYPLDKISDHYIRAEEIPQEEVEMGANDQLIFVKHICPDKYMARPFGNLFLLPISPKETVKSIRSRIQKKLGVKAEEIAEWTFKVCKYSQTGPDLEDDFELGTHIFGDHQFLGMQHVDSTPQQTASYSSYRRKEQAIKIYN